MFKIKTCTKVQGMWLDEKSTESINIPTACLRKLYLLNFAF